MSRIAGRRGRLPAHPVTDRFPVKYLHEYLAQPLPAPAYPVDVTGGITDWGMLGNGPDPACTSNPGGVGDCTFAGRQHNRMAKAAAGGEAMPAETSDQLVAEYFAYDGGRDQGAVIADLLLAWYQDGKILAFAPVDHGDPAAVDAAMQAFHGVYAGVNLTGDADQLFQDGEPWTVAAGQQPDPADGHCIVKVSAEGGPLQNLPHGVAYDGWVTWGALQHSTIQWTAACLQEAWVIITQEDADAASLDVAALRADIDALHGTGGASEPAPAPEPDPAPQHPHDFVHELLADARALAAKAEAWLAEHTRI